MVIARSDVFSRVPSTIPIHRDGNLFDLGEILRNSIQNLFGGSLIKEFRFVSRDASQCSFRGDQCVSGDLPESEHSNWTFPLVSEAYFPMFHALMPAQSMTNA